MSPVPACRCGRGATACRRCKTTSATSPAQLRLSAPVLVSLDDGRRRAAVAALAALLAPYVAPGAPTRRTSARHAGRRRASHAHGDGGEHDSTNQPRRHARPEDEEERRWPEGP